MAVFGPVTGRVGVDGVVDGVGVPSPPPLVGLTLGLALGLGEGFSHFWPSNLPFTSASSLTLPSRSFQTRWTVIRATDSDGTPVWVIVAVPPLGSSPVMSSALITLMPGSG